MRHHVLVVVGGLLLAGCLNAGDGAPPEGHGPPEDAWSTRFADAPPEEEHARDGPLVLVTERFRVDVNGDTEFEASYGPHCAPTAYDAARDDPFVRFHFRPTDAPEPEGVLVHVIDLDDIHAAMDVGVYPEHGVSSDGQRVRVLEDGARVLTVDSPFDADVTRFRVTFQDESILVDDTSLGPGEHADLRFTETVDGDGGTLRVTSDVRVRFVGDAGLYVRAPPAGCD